MKWYFPILMLVFQFSIAQKKSTKEIDYDQNISKAKEIFELNPTLAEVQEFVHLTED